MNKSIKFTPPGIYSGYNGTTNLHGIEVETDSPIGGIRITPVNSRGAASSTFLEVHYKDIPALIALLQESIGQIPAPANNGESEVRMFQVSSFDTETGSLGVVRGTTAEELDAALERAVDNAFFIDKNTLTIPEIDWNFWEKRHTEEVTVSFIFMGQPRNETLQLTYTWEA